MQGLIRARVRICVLALIAMVKPLKKIEESLTNPNVVVTITNKKNTNSNYSNYQVREMQDKNGKVIAYSAYNPNTGKKYYHEA
ncbi:hypothetical protein BSPWISOXPB_1572 [uncultured Gammaproteobacteria bacterium]|nr:hypothetical protein BSPWISOXPB_1572 [uncultured Gammaproteobacteria bacterium]